MAEAGDGRGAQVVVADRLDISQPYVSQILSSVRTDIGVEAIEKAKTRLGLGSRFFDDENLGDDPAYTDHLGERVVLDDDPGHALAPVRAAVAAYLATPEGARHVRLRQRLEAAFSGGTVPSSASVRSMAHDILLEEELGPKTKAPPPKRPGTRDVPKSKR